MSEPEISGNCYASGELRLMRYGQKLRQRMFGTLLSYLHKVGITANQLTLCSLMTGIAACFFVETAPVLFFTMLALHVFFDGLDGPLARLAGKESDRGSMNDSAADQCVLTAVVFTLIAHQQINAVVGGLFALLYCMVVAMAMIRNHRKIPYRFLLRPRFFFYFWLAAEQFFWPGSMIVLLCIFNAVLMIHTVQGFFAIRNSVST